MTSMIQADLIEKYQMILEKDPDSKVFAPLAEAYRRMGLKDEALQVCKQGVLANPHFAGGRIALARCLLEFSQLEKACEELKIAVELASENILAHSLLADTLLQLKKPKEALRAYKMLLFLNPQHAKAAKMVKKLESLTADEFEEEIFAMQPLPQAAEQLERESALVIEPLAPSTPPTDLGQVKELERFLSLTDAFMIRNDKERALKTLHDAERSLGMLPEIAKRYRLLRGEDEPPHNKSELKTPTERPLSLETARREEKVATLKKLLARVRHMQTLGPAEL